MSKHFSQIFISNIRKLRIALGITEIIMDLLLQEYDLVYSGVESDLEKVISLDLAKQVCNLFGKEIEYFLNENCKLITKDKIPKETQNYLAKISEKQSSIDKKTVKISLAACVIIYLNYYNTKIKFANSDILPYLPTPLNQLKSIDWSSGLLKGLVFNTKTYKKNPLISDKRNLGEAYYELKGPIPMETLDKALKKVDLALFKQVDKLIDEKI
ncbi:hypothetical protein [Sphingobacterium faecium]